MRVIELSLRNYRVFEEVDLELPPHVIGIFGQNGAGKSTLLESIGFACYGVDACRTKKQDIRSRGVLTDCEVRLVFEHGGQEYEVRRSVKGRNHFPDAALFVGGKQLAAGTSPVSEEIQKLLRMDLHVFRASVFAEQKQLDAFSSMRKGERKEMVRRLLGIKPVDKAVDAARAETRTKASAAEALAKVGEDISDLELEVKETKARAQEASAEAKKALTELRKAERSEKETRKVFEASEKKRIESERLARDLENTREHLREVAEALAMHRSRLEALDEQLADLGALQEELRELDGAPELLRVAEELSRTLDEIERLHAELEALPQVDVESAEAAHVTAQDALQSARDAHNKASARALHADERLSEAEERRAKADEADPSEPCPTCGRALGADFAEYLKHCAAAVKKAKGASTEAQRDFKAADKQLSIARQHAAEKQVERDKAREASQRLSTISLAIEERQAEAGSLREALGVEEPDIEVLKARVDRQHELRELVATLKGQGQGRTQIENDIAKAEQAISIDESKIAQLDVRLSEVAFNEEAHEDAVTAHMEADDALELARLNERDASTFASNVQGEAAKLEGQLERAQDTLRQVGEMRDEARLLDRVSQLLGGFRDHLVTRIGPELSHEAEALFRELTDREYDDLKIAEEDLSIKIADGDEYFPIERFSGSEIDLANLALRVAISAHLSRVAGADVGLLVLDEVLGSLDQERKDLMVSAMGRLSGRFHQLFIITHAEQVKEQLPAAVLVRKVGRRRSVAELV